MGLKFPFLDVSRSKISSSNQEMSQEIVSANEYQEFAKSDKNHFGSFPFRERAEAAHPRFFPA